jgi:hypothetical protein
MGEVPAFQADATGACIKDRAPGAAGAVPVPALAAFADW